MSNIAILYSSKYGTTATICQSIGKQLEAKASVTLVDIGRKYNPQNEMFRIFKTKRIVSQNEMFFFFGFHPHAKNASDFSGAL